MTKGAYATGPAVLETPHFFSQFRIFSVGPKYGRGFQTLGRPRTKLKKSEAPKPKKTTKKVTEAPKKIADDDEGEIRSPTGPTRVLLWDHDDHILH